MIHENYPDAHHDVYSKTVFGFWVYLLTDFVLFGALFATYSVLLKGTYGGPTASDLFNLPFTLVQTLVLLCASFSAGVAGIFAHRRNKTGVIAFFGLAFLLGLIFMLMEWSELSGLVCNGNGWQRSAFLSAFFTLVGTFWLHMVFALLWTLLLLIPVWRRGLDIVSLTRLTCLRMFWQFLNVVWVFIFLIVYLLKDNAYA